MIEITAGSARLSVLPGMGGGLGGLWVEGRPVLRPWSGDRAAGPFALACNLLVPFSNRISGGGFDWQGARHAVAPNLPGEACPIHGEGFQRIWIAERPAPDLVLLSLPDGEIGPFRYRAMASYHLTPQALETRLSVTNTGPQALPFGLGFHPWFPRGADTRLHFTAAGEWPEGPGHLPATPAPVPLDAGGPWAMGAALPDGWINMGFSGWDGQALIRQGPEAVSLRLAARGLGTALVYSPSAAADFFCFEPVSHPVDAHNLPGQPGLVPLAPGASLEAAMTLTWGPAAEIPSLTERD